MTLQAPRARWWLGLGAMGIALAALFSTNTPAAPEPSLPPRPAAPTTASVPYETISPALRGLALPLSEPILEALRERRWEAAAKALTAMDSSKLVGPQKGDWAFLCAYALSHSGQAESAQPYLALIQDADSVPASYAALVEGEVLRDLEKWEEALVALDRVPADSSAWPRAAVQRAEVLRKMDRTADAWSIYEALAARPDPSPGSAVALLALARRAGIGSPDAYPLLRRVWVAYPRTDESIEAAKLLESYPGPKYQPTWQEVGKRAERLMEKNDLAGAILETGRRAAEVTGNSEDACRFIWVRGRSLYRSNKLTDAAAAIGDAGERCKDVPTDYGARSLYILGQAKYRKGEYLASAAANEKIAQLYPKSSFADDGLTQAGFAWQEAGRLEDARRVWERALVDFPDGDTVPESTFRLAFALYLDGKPEEALKVADRLAALPVRTDAANIAAGRYWAARLRMFPDVAHPEVRTTDPKRKEEAIARWKSLCEDQPHSFYAILAWSRLKEEDSALADKVAVRPANFDHGSGAGGWQVRTEFIRDEKVRTGLDLARLGLIQEAMAEWSDVDQASLTGDEKAWMTELRILSGDWLLAHDDMRKWMTTHPPGTLGERQSQVLRVAYPDRYWDLVKKHAPSYRYEPRLFHALVREESNFNRVIQSPVGARGLSQLMPATAQETARWMKIKVTNSQLDDPDTNLKIGARYLDSVHGSFGGSPYLSLAGYNAGPGRVRQWLTEWGNVPTDEYVERIPFRETRGYVRRVMGSWQTMRWQFDDGPLFYDLSAYNHKSKKE